jgi:DNA polymerase
MGGDLDQASTAELRSALRWWLDAGVDAVITEEPRNWLKPKPKTSAQQSEAKPQAFQTEPLPHETLDAFREWLRGSSDLPFTSPTGRRVLPSGAAESPIMLLADMPPLDAADGEGPIGGDAWRLMQLMLAAIGLKPQDAYRASLSCFNSLAGFRGPDLKSCAEIARRHIALVKPQRLLLLGDTPCRALLGKPLAAARGTVQKIEGVRAVATFHPSFLLMHPLQKEAAWADLLLLTEDQ